MLMIFDAVAVPENIQHFITKIDGEKGANAAQNYDAPIGVGCGDDLLEKGGEDRLVIGVGTIGKGIKIDGNGYGPDKNFTIEHTDAKDQANGKIQQKSGISHRRTENKKAPGECGDNTAGQDAIFIAQITEIQDQYAEKQQELDHNFAVGLDFMELFNIYGQYYNLG